VVENINEATEVLSGLPAQVKYGASLLPGGVAIARRTDRQTQRRDT
jgi:hypothetical protein